MWYDWVQRGMLDEQYEQQFKMGDVGKVDFVGIRNAKKAKKLD